MQRESPRPKEHKPNFGAFLAAAVVIFVLSLSAADSIGFVPCAIDGTCTRGMFPLSDLPMLGDAANDTTAANASSVLATALPARIKIDSINLDLSVQNPGTRDLDTLDLLLQKGPARYVDSAKLGESGNMIIFAHSSHLPIVHNLMFKAFNRIPELKAGDTITIEGSDGKQYLYNVTSVEKANVDSAKIDLSRDKGTRLTLVTCDTLTGKSARFVLEADFVGVASNEIDINLNS